MSIEKKTNTCMKASIRLRRIIYLRVYSEMK